MKNQLLTLFAALSLLVALAPNKAAAQAPPMDMSWAFRQQMQYQVMGDQAARNAAQNYYNYMVRLRQMGYQGPSLPTGVTSQTLQDSNRSLQETMDRYHKSSQVNSAKRSVAVDDYTMRAVRGCQLLTRSNGTRYYYCP